MRAPVPTWFWPAAGLTIVAGGLVGSQWARTAGCYGLSCVFGTYWGVLVGALVADLGFVVLLFASGRQKKHLGETTVGSVASRWFSLVPVGLFTMVGLMSLLVVQQPGAQVTAASIASGLLLMHYLGLRGRPAVARLSTGAEVLVSLLVFLVWPFVLGAPYAWGFGCRNLPWVEKVLVNPMTLLTMVIAAASAVHGTVATLSSPARLQHVARRQFVVFAILSGASLVGAVIVSWDVCH